MQLNELEKSMEGVIPTTDCRLRPDIRAMENGDIGMKKPIVLFKITLLRRSIFCVMSVDFQAIQRECFCLLMSGNLDIVEQKCLFMCYIKTCIPLFQIWRVQRRSG